VRPVAIVQARMGSTRLPGKVLLPLGDKPILFRVVERLRFVPGLADVVVATTDSPADEPIRAFCRSEGILCFSGSEDDVLDRYYHAARDFGADPIVRVTSDCPLVDPAIVGRALDMFEAGRDNIVYVGSDPRLPDGLDVEVVAFEALETAWREAKLPSEREHVTPFIWKQPERFPQDRVSSPRDLSHERWTVDRLEDYELVQAVHAALYRSGHPFGMAEILGFVEAHPELRHLNEGIVRNEGYLKSVGGDPVSSDTPADTPARIGVASPDITRSRSWWERAVRVIPNGTQTLSKGPDQFVRGVSPIFLERGRGSHVWDVDGNEYIDYPMALGPILLGYDYPPVTEAVCRQAREGTTFTLMHPLEVEVAERLCGLIPCAEMVRFGKNGADATSAAVRVARAYTGRDEIAYCGYHGYQDWFAITAARNGGIPEVHAKYIHPFEYNDPSTLERVFREREGKIAAVIMEQPGIEPENDFLTRVGEITRQHGAVFILDEIVTGFRYAKGGAQELYGVVPDMACFGKGMANGYPISAVVGRREVMMAFENVFFSTTYGGETVALAAARATLDTLDQEPVIDHIWRLGAALREGILRAATESQIPLTLGGNPPRSGLVFQDGEGRESSELKTLFMQETVKRGVLFGGPVFISYSHSDADIRHTIDAVAEAFRVMRRAIDGGSVGVFLEGEVAGTVFRPRS
jgi:glutamate-1-semialdehyde aminotransferase/spore coat polysaccharide biosynthesis protein SpsF (cytidylyltransferase family)